MTRLACPFCAAQWMYADGGVFYEEGEFDGTNYENEGSIPTYRCQRAQCGMRIAVIVPPGEIE